MRRPARDAGHDPTRSDLSARPRPGHLELAQHRLRCAAAASSRWRSASSARSIRSRAGSSTIRTRSGPRSSRPRARCWPRPACGAATSRRSASPTSARPRVVWNRAHRRADRQRHRLAGPARRADLRRAARARPRAARSAPRPGLVIDAYFSGTKLKWMLDHIPGARAAAGARRAGLRHRRQLADVARSTGGAACMPPT